MTARSIYEAAAAPAEASKNSTIASAMATYSNSLAAGTDPKVAYKTLMAACLQAEMTKQVTIQAAKDVLRATGDLAPA